MWVGEVEAGNVKAIVQRVWWKENANFLFIGSMAPSGWSKKRMTVRDAAVLFDGEKVLIEQEIWTLNALCRCRKTSRQRPAAESTSRNSLPSPLNQARIPRQGKFWGQLCNLKNGDYWGAT
jgi:hypothetical protein